MSKIKFLEKTDIEELRDVVSMLLYTDIHLTEIPFIISHPIHSISSTYIDNDSNIYNLLDKKDLSIVNEKFNEHIMKSDLIKLYMLIRDPYKLTFMKYAMPFMSQEDFSKYLAHSWVVEENPNQDVNCSIPCVIKMFKACDKKFLMEPKDYKVYESLPETITVYRGVAIGRNPKGISWTNNLSTAKWFAKRFDNEKEKGYVEVATISKSKVLAYFNTRNEDELVCDIRKEDISILED